MNAKDYIKLLGLQVHPEGGYYRETYRAGLQLPASLMEASLEGHRVASTAIYFLLEAGNFSAFHRIRSDECWHFYAGDSLDVIEIDEAGKLLITTLGHKSGDGACFQYCVKAGRWFASRVSAGGNYSLVGCTVAPGFDFQDFEMADRQLLSRLYPAHAAIIGQLTRKINE